VVEKGSLFFRESVFHHLGNFFCLSNWWWCVCMRGLFFCFKDRKSFTVETVSSTPTMSRSSSISGVDMAGLQTSFLSQVSYISYIVCFFFFLTNCFFSSSRSFISVEITLWEYVGLGRGNSYAETSKSCLQDVCNSKASVKDSVKLQFLL